MAFRRGRGKKVAAPVKPAPKVAKPKAPAKAAKPKAVAKPRKSVAKKVEKVEAKED